MINEFYDSLTPKEWKEYHTKMNDILSKTYGNFTRLDNINGKLVQTVFNNGKEQVTNIYGISENSNYLTNYIMEEVNNGYYSDEQIQRFIEDMLGQEDVSIYNPTSNQFEPLSKSREDSGLSIGEDTGNDRRTTKERDGENNKRTKELDNSSFSFKININNV